MIRVLHVIGSMNRGGAETFIMNVYRHINRDEVQFDFLLEAQKEGAYDKEILELGGKIFFYIPRKESIFKNKKSLETFFKKHSEYKIVHQHASSQSNIEPLKAAKKAGVPVRILHSHSTRQGGSKIHKYIHKYNQVVHKNTATRCFACSDLAGQWMYGKQNFEIINNGIDTNKFSYNPKKRKQIRKKLNIQSDQFVVGHIGNFVEVKNHEFVIEIFKEMLKIEPSSLLLLVGDGRLKVHIQDMVNKYNLSNNVKFTGLVENPEDYLQAMDAFVFPSFYEGFPVTLVEAQVSGLPCFISDHITRSVKICDNVFFEDISDNPIVWANNILAYKEKKYKRSNSIRNIIQKGFDIRHVARKLEDEYCKYSYYLKES